MHAQSGVWCAAVVLCTLPGASLAFSVPGVAPSLSRAAGPAHLALSSSVPSLARLAHRRTKAGAATLGAALDGYDSLLTLDSPAAWAAFILWSVPLPATIGALLRYAEQVSGYTQPVIYITRYTPSYRQHGV
jgi:hypothetical protein